MIETTFDIIDMIRDKNIERAQKEKQTLEKNNFNNNTTKIKIPSESPTLTNILLSFFENLKKK